MNQILKIGETVGSEKTGGACKVESFLGGGGQGEVYRVSCENSPMALKWYFPKAITSGHENNLERIIKIGPPNDKFLWPIALILDSNVKGFGYIMPLRDEQYKGIVDMMKRRTDPTFKALAMAGFNLSDSFLQLHSKGMCYSDISFGNVFMHPETGDVLICDNDNCIFDGERASIKGTPRFMAPEVVLGGNPSIHTDLFSLAVLLFYMFFLHHPLEGEKEASIKCFDLPAMNMLYGSDPVFIFDPVNDSNRPVKGYQDNALVFWDLYPQFLKNLFTKAFTVGIKDPINGRVRETEWRAAMLRLYDSIVYCTNCGAENFYDLNKVKEAGGKGESCWSCQKTVVLPPRIKTNKHVVMLNHNTKLYPYHVDDKSPYDFSKPVAEINQHPKNPKIWGLKNLGQEKWVSVAANGKVQDVEPGQSVTLAVGTKISFGKSEGEIRL